MLADWLGLGEASELQLRVPWPAWVMVLLLAAGVGYALLVYRREPALSPVRRALLGGMRAAVYVVLLLLLFEPVISTAKKVIVPSNVLVLLDVSESMQIEDPRQSEEDLEEAARALGEYPPAHPRAGAGSAPSSGDAAGDGSEAREGLSSRVRAEVARVSRIELARGILNHPDVELFREDDGRRRVHYFRFGERLEPASGEGESVPTSLETASATATRTQIGSALQDAVDRYSGQKIDGMILLTDGASNGGLDPVEVARRLGERSVPVFPIGLGLARPDDVRLKAVIVQDTVFEKDRVPVRVEIASDGFEGRTIDITASIDGAEVARESVVLEGDSQFVELSFVPEGSAGNRQLEVTIAPIAGETSPENNRVERSLRVIDEKIRVLYVEGRPRWEYRYLRAVLLRDPRLVVKFLLTEGDPDLAKASPRYIGRFPDREEDAARYDLVILGDVPSYFLSAEQLGWVEKLVREKGGSFLLLAGPDHAPQSYGDTALAALLPVKPVPGVRSPVHSSVHPVVTEEGTRSQMVLLGSTERETDAIWSLVRPLYGLPRLEGARAGATVLLTLSRSASLGGAAAQDAYPLIAWQRYGAGKSLFVGTDQLWRLRYRQGDRYHARFWGQAIRFLTLSRLLGENKRIRIETERRQYRSGERVDIYGNVLTESFDPMESDSYTVMVGAEHFTDPVAVELRPVPGNPGLYQGHYTPDREGVYQIGAGAADAAYASSASIEVTPFRREKLEPDKQEDLLRKIAALSGGEYVTMEDLPLLTERLPLETSTMTVHTERELWDHWSIFLVLLCLVGLEWFLRRRYDLA